MTDETRHRIFHRVTGSQLHCSRAYQNQVNTLQDVIDDDRMRNHLRHFDLARWNLADLQARDKLFYECDFTGAILRWSALVCAQFQSCAMRGVDLSGANLTRTEFSYCDDIIDAGLDPRGWRFIGVRGLDDAKEVYTIQAGCRRFTHDQALEHWERNNAAECLMKVDYIHRVACARNWL